MEIASLRTVADSLGIYRFAVQSCLFTFKIHYLYLEFKVYGTCARDGWLWTGENGTTRFLNRCHQKHVLGGTFGPHHIKVLRLVAYEKTLREWVCEEVHERR